MNAPAFAIEPVRRNFKFPLKKSKITHWNGAGRNFTHFLNALSVFFPEGERFFIDSVRNYRDQITAPQLKRDVSAFIGQEAFHSREHVEYNNALAEAGFPVEAYEKVVAILLDNIKERTPKAFQLSITVALEHITAILANGVLETPEAMEGSDEGYVALWHWHALEETEHKAVAFDVFNQVVGGGLGSYLLRTGTFTFANAVFWPAVAAVYLDILRRDKQLSNLKGWRATYDNMWGKNGILKLIIPDWLDYYKPGFHPWDHDNRHLLKRVEEIIAVVGAPKTKATKKTTKKVSKKSQLQEHKV